MRLHWIWLALHPDLIDLEKKMLMEYYREPEELFFADQEENWPEELVELIRKARANRSLKAAETVLEDCAREGLRIVTFGEKDYPQRLKNIADPPMVLYCKGKLPPLDALPAIGVVGTRKASAYGLNTARQMGWQLARCGGAVVSGMALGIDAMAMRGALAAGGMVVGVLGCGAEQVYPKANRALFAETEQFGCILSEFPPGTPPHKWNFPRRNRIISGLSCGVLVVEAPEKSGSLITARQAAEQGRDVFVVPGNVDLPSFAGSYRLMREGATPASSGWEVLSEYESRFPEKIHKDLSPMEAASVPEMAPEPREKLPKVAQKPTPPERKSAIREDSDKKVIDKLPPAPYIDLNDILPKLSADERVIVTALKDGERLVDDVIAETGLTTGKMLAGMTVLELKGIVKRLPGKRIVLK